MCYKKILQIGGNFLSTRRQTDDRRQTSCLPASILTTRVIIRLCSVESPIGDIESIECQGSCKRDMSLSQIVSQNILHVIHHIVDMIANIISIRSCIIK